MVGEDGTLLADGSGNIFYEGTDRTFSPAMFRYGGAYMQGQRFFPESEWRGTYKEDTLSYTLAATGNFDFRDAIWDWELALVNDEYNFQRGGLEVTESGLEAWSCGAAINTVYASSCNSSIYGFSLFNPDTFWGPASLAESYGLWIKELKKKKL